MNPSAVAVKRIARFGVNSNRAERLVRFYVEALHCREVGRDRLEGASFRQLMGVRGGATRHTLSLGLQSLEILQFDDPGVEYPDAPASTDDFFQHFALVVRDMSMALAVLSGVDGWTSISVDGSRHLPATSGGVTAFKFRDPDGHPLELLQFPAANVPTYWRRPADDECFLGIDHSALAVSNPTLSMRFYEELGFRAISRTLNEGVAQERLDDVARARVDVIALAAAAPTPHLEFLHYRGVRVRSLSLRSNDVASSRLVLSSVRSDPCSESVQSEKLLLDPDGHRLHLVFCRTPA